MSTLIKCLVIVILLAAGLECFLRLFLGLGDPPLFVFDREIEYRYAPNRSYNRFGNYVYFNSYSMRSQEPPSESQPKKRRVLVLGDSVVNGGALTDQYDLATEILARRLAPNVWVGNVSAGSWGPANLLAYIKRYGWFDADTVFIVVSSHDLDDLPDFRSSYGPSFPTTTPVSAFAETVTRYIPRYFSLFSSFLQTAPDPSSLSHPSEARRRLGKAALWNLIELAKRQARSVIVILHPTRSELGAAPSSQRVTLTKVIKDTGVFSFDLLTKPGWSKQYYRDDIHLNRRGQLAYTDLFECLLRLSPRTAKPHDC